MPEHDFFHQHPNIFDFQQHVVYGFQETLPKLDFYWAIFFHLYLDLISDNLNWVFALLKIYMCNPSLSMAPLDRYLDFDTLKSALQKTATNSF